MNFMRNLIARIFQKPHSEIVVEKVYPSLDQYLEVLNNCQFETTCENITEHFRWDVYNKGNKNVFYDNSVWKTLGKRIRRRIREFERRIADYPEYRCKHTCYKSYGGGVGGPTTAITWELFVYYYDVVIASRIWKIAQRRNDVRYQENYHGMTASITIGPSAFSKENTVSIIRKW